LLAILIVGAVVALTTSCHGPATRSSVTLDFSCFGFIGPDHEFGPYEYTMTVSLETPEWTNPGETIDVGRLVVTGQPYGDDTATATYLDISGASPDSLVLARPDPPPGFLDADQLHPLTVPTDATGSVDIAVDRIVVPAPPGESSLDYACSPTGSGVLASIPVHQRS